MASLAACDKIHYKKGFGRNSEAFFVALNRPQPLKGNRLLSEISLSWSLEALAHSRPTLKLKLSP